MAGVSFEADLDLASAQRAFARLGAAEIDAICDAVGQLIETQTKTRLAEEKTAPDGTPWAAWSESYAAYIAERGWTARSILLGEGNLMGSVQNLTRGERVEVGSNLVYAAIHQFGGEDVGIAIPARPWLGLSPANSREIEELVADLIGQEIRQ